MSQKLLQPLIFSRTDYKKQIDLIKANLHSHNPIPTKYAYLGWHGAKTWYSLKEEVHSKISPTKELLEKYLPSILNTVFYSNTIDGDEINGINIISLGIGSGDEDQNFLSILDNLNSKLKINYYAIDYSFDLLAYSLARLTNYYNKLEKPQIHLNKLIGLCFDIDIPWITQPIFKSNSKYNRNKLFHLLGFTLGNNREEAFLRNILSLMKEGDYLLFDIDFSADDLELIKFVHQSYKNKTEISNQFLLNSIYYLTQILNRAKANSFAVGIQGINGVEIIYDNLEELTLQSDITVGTKSLTRKHKYHLTRGSDFEVSESICDFSNKYKSAAFIDWLAKMSKKLGFEIIKNGEEVIYMSDKGLTGLIFIKKTKVKNKEIKKIANRDKQIDLCLKWLNDNKNDYRSPYKVEELISKKDKWKKSLIDDILNENITITTLMNFYISNNKRYLYD